LRADLDLYRKSRRDLADGQFDEFLNCRDRHQQVITMEYRKYRIRTARTDDAIAFSPLLASLGYPSTPSSLKSRIATILQNPDAVLLVATPTTTDRVLGLLSLHFIPQLGLEGDVARIGFLVVDETCHSAGIGKLLETHAEELSRKRGCDRMVIP
jgi:ribosomal protein S18 acetylase RimI-like enzyme